VNRFRGGVVFQAHRLLYHSTLSSRVMKRRRRIQRKTTRISKNAYYKTRSFIHVRRDLPLSSVLSRHPSILGGRLRRKYEFNDPIFKMCTYLDSSGTALKTRRKPIGRAPSNFEIRVLSVPDRTILLRGYMCGVPRCNRAEVGPWRHLWGYISV
jgi:hypothetical protein